MTTVGGVSATSAADEFTYVAAEISVSADIGGAVTDGGTNPQGNQTAGSAVTVTYTVTNSGTGDLTLGTATSSNSSGVTINSIGAPVLTTVTSGGGTTTFQVQYTPTVAGAFSFDLSFVTNDSDENPFNFTVSGTGIGAPEIAVSSSVSGALIDGGTDAQGAIQTGVQTTVTYTVTNSGNIPLMLTGTASASAASNVVVDSVSAYGVSSVPAAGSTSFTVTYTPAAAAAFSFELDIVSDDADEANFDITVSGTITGVPAGISVLAGDAQSAEVGTVFPLPLSALVVDNGSNPVAGVVVTFTAPASGPSLSFAATGTNVETVTTGADGVATSSMMTANSIASAYTGGGSLSSYMVTASAPGLGSVSYSLTNRRNSAADIQKTKEVIAAFVTNRADRIVSGQPDIVKRLTGGAFAEQSNFNGFSVLVTPYSTTGEFDFSLGAFRHRLEQGPVKAMEAHTSALGYATTGSGAATTGSPISVAADDGQASQAQDAPRSGFDVWARGTYARIKNNNSDSTNGLFFAGVDYRFGNRAVVGLMASLDLTDEENGAANSSASGVGWMAGPYGVINLHDNLYADARVTYGRSDNKVNALGLFTDSFDTERLLMQAGLTGDFQVGAARVNPFARLTYFREEQKSYVDTLGNTIPSQEFDLGRLEFGPKLTFALEPMNDMDLSLSLGFSGIYDFDMLDETTATNPSLASASRKLRGRVEGGVEVRTSQRGVRVAGDLFYDGIGVANYHAYGGGLMFRVPF